MQNSSEPTSILQSAEFLNKLPYNELLAAYPLIHLIQVYPKFLYPLSSPVFLPFSCLKYPFVPAEVTGPITTCCSPVLEAGALEASRSTRCAWNPHTSPCSSGDAAPAWEGADSSSVILHTLPSPPPFPSFILYPAIHFFQISFWSDVLEVTHHGFFSI